ncbi:MAG: hypothetical protein J6S67_18195 [Methanobrevibacter sp.]|nr:hypothetical protein [Methanobrevibacter sp.]
MNRVLFSSLSDDWTTPKDIYDWLDREFHFTFDPCPLYSDFDGLLIDWTGDIVFCNPPYSNILPWVQKSYLESCFNGVTVVLLLPARTDSKWFHDFILPFCSEIRFIRGRLKFGGAKYNAPFPSMVCIFGGKRN